MANMIVSGAGDTDANGTYEEFGTLNDRPIYRNEFGFTISWTNTMWVIRLQQDIYYLSNDDVGTPDLCTAWEVDSGSPPAPTVTKEQEFTGIPKHFLHYARMRGN